MPYFLARAFGSHIKDASITWSLKRRKSRNLSFFFLLSARKKPTINNFSSWLSGDAHVYCWCYVYFSACDPVDQFACVVGGKCVPALKVCDSTPDCDDGSDETTEVCGKSCDVEPDHRCEWWVMWRQRYMLQLWVASNVKSDDEQCDVRRVYACVWCVLWRQYKVYLHCFDGQKN